MSGVGTARMIHGYVAKIHDDPSDEEFAEYGGTELDAESDSSPDHDELEPTGNATSTRYTGLPLRNDKNKETTTGIDAESITHTVDKSEVKQTADKVVRKVNSTIIAVADSKATLGDEQAAEPLVPGNELAQLMPDFLPHSRIQKFLSKTSYTK